MLSKTEDEIICKWHNPKGNPKVSVCCITFNHEGYIRQALESFLIQETDFPFEIVVRDDASTDKTAEIIAEYQTKYPNIIRVIFNDINGYSKGIRPLPELLKVTRGEYLAICEGDDYWLDSNKLQKQIDAMSEYPSCELSCHPARIVDDVSLTSRLYGYCGNKIRVIKLGDAIKNSGDYLPTSSFVMKRDILPKAQKFYSTVVGGDYIYQILGSEKNGALFLPDVMSVYRVNAQGAWTASMATIEKRKGFFQKYEQFSILLNNYFDGKYKAEVLTDLEYQFYLTAVMFIKNDGYDDYIAFFKDYFKKSEYATHRMKVLYIIGKFFPTSVVLKVSYILLLARGNRSFLSRVVRKVQQLSLT